MRPAEVRADRACSLSSCVTIHCSRRGSFIVITQLWPGQCDPGHVSSHRLARAGDTPHSNYCFLSRLLQFYCKHLAPDSTWRWQLVRTMISNLLFFLIGIGSCSCFICLLEYIELQSADASLIKLKASNFLVGCCCWQIIADEASH